MAREFEVTGRIVQGHPMRAVQKKDNDGKVVLGADGQPRMIRQFTLAVPKADFMRDAWEAMHAEATSAFPNALQMKQFSWKIKQDTEVDKKGVPYSAREGYSGCIALNISSELPVPPPLYRQSPNGQFIQMGPDEIKCGDYCFVRVNCKVQVPKNNSHTPSLYMNPAIIIFVGYGSEIAGPQIDPNEAFKGRMFGLPAGASAMPTAPAMAAAVPSPAMGATAPAGMPGVGMPGQPGMPASGYPAAMPGIAAAPPGMPIQPAVGFVAAAAGMPGQPAAYPPGMTPAAAAMPIPGMGGAPTLPGR